MKKKFLFSAIALLSISIVFMGCPDDGDGDEPSAEEKAATALVTTLGGDSKATVSGTTVTLKADVEISKDASVPAGVTLIVAKDTELTVSDSTTLTVNGTVTVKSGGTLISPPVDPETGLPSDSDGMIDFGDSGKVEFEKGAIASYGEVNFIGTDDSLYKWDSDGTDSKVTLKADNVTELTAGKVTCIAPLDSDTEFPTTGIAPDTTIVIKKGATLTIDKGFAVGGTLTIDGEFKGVTDAILVFVGEDATVGGTGKSIFYLNDTNSAGAADTGKAYKWTATAGGTSKPGWKAQS